MSAHTEMDSLRLELVAGLAKQFQGIVDEDFPLDAVRQGRCREHQLAGLVLAQDEWVVAAQDDAVLAHLFDQEIERVRVVHERVHPDAAQVRAGPGRAEEGRVQPAGRG